MNKIILIGLLFLSFGLIGCKKDTCPAFIVRCNSFFKSDGHGGGGVGYETHIIKSIKMPYEPFVGVDFDGQVVTCSDAVVSIGEVEKVSTFEWKEVVR